MSKNKQQPTKSFTTESYKYKPYNPDELNISMPPRTPPTKAEREKYEQTLKNYVSPFRKPTHIAGLTPYRASSSSSSASAYLHSINNINISDKKKAIEKQTTILNYFKRKGGSRKSHSAAKRKTRRQRK